MNPPAELSPDARKLIPLTPAVFFVLLSLASEAKHGYAVMQEVEHLSDGEVRMGPATLYTTIQRLSDLGLVSEVAPPGDEEAGRRRYYEITSQGRGLLDVELARMKSLVRRAHALLAIKPAGGKLMPPIVSFSLWVYRAFLPLYPPEFRKSYGGEMLWLFERQLTDASSSAGVWGILRVWWLACRDFACVALPGHLHNERFVAFVLSAPMTTLILGFLFSVLEHRAPDIWISHKFLFGGR